MKVRNTFIIFLVSGFWHGANWTFIIWGALNAIYFLPLLLLNSNRTNLETVAQGKMFPTIKEIFQMSITFFLTVLAWIFFRAASVTQAVNYIATIFSKSLFKIPDKNAFIGSNTNPIVTVFLILFFLMIEWLGREQQYAIQQMGLKWYKPVRWAFYYVLVIALFLFMGKEQQFIYFQF